VADHPLFPGSTTGVSVTFEQFKVRIFFSLSVQELKNVDMVFASVVKNDDLLRDT
jgi:hypothetical protein